MQKIKPYLELMRLHQPVGIFLLLWPCLISLNLASNGSPSLALIVIFIIGSIVMRSAGCIFNDLVDHKFDKEVFRTKDRPIASGVVSKESAKKLLVFLLAIAFFLSLFLSELAIMISFLAVPLIALYPFFKRFTYWPQLCLGITFNLGALVAWAAVRPELNLQIIALYIGFIFWTLGYDTIYAHQDKDDDLKLGLKSTAIKFADKTEKYLNAFYTMFFTLTMFAFGISGITKYFYVIMTIPIMILFWQVKTIDINNRNNCARRFKSNIIVGAFIFLASLMSGVHW